MPICPKGNGAMLNEREKKPERCALRRFPQWNDGYSIYEHFYSCLLATVYVYGEIEYTAKCDCIRIAYDAGLTLHDFFFLIAVPYIAIALARSGPFS